MKFAPRTDRNRINQSIHRQPYTKPPSSFPQPRRDPVAPMPLLHAFVVSSHGSCMLCREDDPTVLLDYNTIQRTVPPGIELVMMCPVGYSTSNTTMATCLLSQILRQRERGNIPRESSDGRRNARRFLSPGDRYIDVALELSGSHQHEHVMQPGVFHRDLRRDGERDPLTNLGSIDVLPPRKNNQDTMLSDLLANTIRPFIGAQSRALVVVDTCRMIVITGHASDDMNHRGVTRKKNCGGVSVVEYNETRPSFFERNNPHPVNNALPATLYDRVMVSGRSDEQVADIAYRNRVARQHLIKILKRITADKRKARQGRRSTG